MNNKDYSRIPASACVLSEDGAFTLGSNGENAKTAPIQLKARSGQPIEHWFWGRVVHDLSGMKMHKRRLPIDYVHDSKEIIGYLSHFDATSGDLLASGALVPFKESDRATEIIHKLNAGVPYEASINFGGDGIKIQEIGDGELVDVNGYIFEGPGVVIREWPLRGVAVCPYGADMNTDSSAFSDNNKTFSAAVTSAPEKPVEEAQMSTSVENGAPVEDAPESEETAVKETEMNANEVVESVEVAEQPEVDEAVEGAEAATEELSEEDEPEAEIKEDGELAAQEEAVEETPEPEAEPEVLLTRSEFCRIADEFGDSIAVKILRTGGDYNSALREYASALKAENEQLRKTKPQVFGQPARVVEAPKENKEKTLFKTGK